MTFIANILVAVVAALHVYFLILEMFLWTRPLGLKTLEGDGIGGAGRQPGLV
jgi:uncharacterized membrane protein